MQRLLNLFRKKNPSLCVLIFEGRTGSSELISRLNSHPNLLFYPEILHAPASPDLSFAERWKAIHQTIDNVANLRAINADLASYQKSRFDPSDIRVVGLKTRLHEPSDDEFFQLERKLGNFYIVEGMRLLEVLEQYQALVIRLRRRDILRTAVSWHRAVAMSNATNQWNVRQSRAPLGPIAIDPQSLVRTMQWVTECRDKHDAAFDSYIGKKISIDYEDMVSQWSSVEKKLLRFLGVPQLALKAFYKKASPDNLSYAVSNLAEIERAMPNLVLVESKE